MAIKINYVNNQPFGARIIYNEATNEMKNLLNKSRGTKNFDVFGALVEGINKMLPNSSDEFMFTKVENNNSLNHSWKAKLSHNGQTINFDSFQPYIEDNTFPENIVVSILMNIYCVAKLLYSFDNKKPKLIFPDWSKFRNRFRNT